MFYCRKKTAPETDNGQLTTTHEGRKVTIVSVIDSASVAFSVSLHLVCVMPSVFAKRCFLSVITFYSSLSVNVGPLCRCYSLAK